MKTYKEKVSIIIQAEETGRADLNEWELGFIDSIDSKLSKGDELTWKQVKTLNRIMEKVE